jgi:hypothetical protein
MVTLRCPDWHHICSFVGHATLRSTAFCASCGSAELVELGWVCETAARGNAIEALDRSSHAARGDDLIRPQQARLRDRQPE